MFFIFFIFSRNTIFGAAEQKCSAEHRLRNPGLYLPQNDLISQFFISFRPKSDFFPLIRCFSSLNAIFFFYIIFGLCPVSINVILLTFQTSIVTTIHRLGLFAFGPFQTFLTIFDRSTLHQRSKYVKKQEKCKRTHIVNGLKCLGPKSGK
jgi:hypothetical protein